MADPALLPAWALLLGLTLGSFVAAAAWRLPQGISLWGRSACPSCGTVLGVRDLVPVLSWLASRGRCRHCGARVSPRYPFIELCTGALWLGCLYVLPDPAEAFTLASLGTVLLLSSLIDLEHRYLPDELTAIAALLAGAPLVLGILEPLAALTGALLFGGLSWGLRAVVSWRVGREAMGLGDVKLMAMAGLWLGPGLLAPFLLLAGVGGLVFALAKRLGGDTAPEVPFGPALVLSLMVLLLLQWGALAPIPGAWPGA